MHFIFCSRLTNYLGLVWTSRHRSTYDQHECPFHLRAPNTLSRKSSLDGGDTEAIFLLRAPGPPLLDLVLADLAEVIDIGHLAGDGALNHLDAAAEHGALGQGVRRRQGLDLDDADARVVLRAVVHAVAQVAHPGAQGGRVVLLHGGAVCDDARRSGDGRPRARCRQERDVHVRVGLQVRRLSGLCVRVEEQVDATGFLLFQKGGSFVSSFLFVWIFTTLA